MSSSDSPPAALPLFLAFCRATLRQAGAGLWRALLLVLGIAALEAGGLLLLVPLLQSVAVGGAGDIRGPAAIASTLLHRTGVSTTLPVVLTAFILLKLAQAGLRAWSETSISHLQIRFMNALRSRLYRAIMNARWPVLSRQRNSDLSIALMNDLPDAALGLQHLVTLFSIVTVAVIQVIVAWTLSFSTTVVALGCGAVVAACLHRVRRRAFALRVAARMKNSEMAAAISEHLAGMKVAKSHGRESHHLAHFEHTMGELADYDHRAHRVHAVAQLAADAATIIALCVFVFFAVQIRHVGAARLVILAFILARLLGQASAIHSIWGQLQRALPSFAATEAMYRRFEAAAESLSEMTAARLEIRRGVRLADVTFRYDGGTTALEEIDLDIRPGEVIAICGPSGAGKSTLADILLGLLKPSSGRVLVDEQDLSDELLRHWRHSLGYVPQDTFLFHETIRSNLLWANPTATPADLARALESSAARQFIDQLPAGIDTVVGERGVRLSGGERQRIALARALLRNPSFLVLDEATSALDTENERSVQDAIARLRGRMTIVLIAHRLSTLRIADRIIVLEHGRITDVGSWPELHGRASGVFKRLVDADAGPT